MTISEAIASEIQPFSTSDETLEKMFIDAVDKFSITASVADEYSVAVKKPVAYAAIHICLNLKYKSRKIIAHRINKTCVCHSWKR